MSQGTHVTDVQEKTQQLLQGRLKHAAAAGLAAALLPLAAVAITATSPEACQSGGVCGFVWYDTNNNGIQDAGELPIEGAVVTLNGTSVATNASGVYDFGVVPGT
jgi:hypothetical protein